MSTEHSSDSVPDPQNSGNVPTSRRQNTGTGTKSGSRTGTPPTGAQKHLTATHDRHGHPIKQWAAVWSMLIGFFMLIIDTLIVSVANPTIQDKLNASLSETIWVTSAYALAIAVPLLVAGRLGDRFGQKNIFMIGMIIFTLGSLGCGLSHTITMLVIMRVVQGIGGALMTPQTQAMIVRIFPPEKRGAPMGLWGAVSGIGMLIAPLAGGLLVDHFGWESIFLVNIPVGIAGIILAAVFIPSLDTKRPSFDWVGVILSGLGMFFLVFGIQEGPDNNWGTVWGFANIWEIIALGAVLLIIFVIWEIKGTKNPLVPMRLFKHRDFAFSSAAITCTGFVVSSMSVPLLYFLQIARGYTAVESALFMLPMAVVAGVFSPLIGAKLIHRLGARIISPAGLLIWVIGCLLYMSMMTPDKNLIPGALIASAIVGLGNACVWSPLSVASASKLPPHEAGAGSSVYNTARQLGTVLGSACISTLMTSRIVANFGSGAVSDLKDKIGTLVKDKIPTSIASSFGEHMPSVSPDTFSQSSDPRVTIHDLVGQVKAPAGVPPEVSSAIDSFKNSLDSTLLSWFSGHFSPAMAESLWLPIGMAVVGCIMALCLTGIKANKPVITPVDIPVDAGANGGADADASASTSASAGVEADAITGSNRPAATPDK